LHPTLRTLIRGLVVRAFAYDAW